MPITTIYNESLDIVEASWAGIITKKELLDTNDEHIRLHKKNGVQKFLNDLLLVEILSLNVFDLFELPNHKYEEATASRKVQIAIITPSTSEITELIGFYKTACSNRGWHVHVFTERDKAIEWLA